MIGTATLRELVAAGLSPEQILAVSEALDVDSKPKDATAAERQQRRRDKIKAEQETSRRDVTRDDHCDAAPSLDKEIPPRPPKEINPIPDGGGARALPRKAGGFSAPSGVPDDRWSAFCQQRKKPVTRIAYDRIVKTLGEGSDVGWPPGELVERAIERGYETVFVPKESRNGQRPSNDREQIHNPILRAGLARRAERDLRQGDERPGSSSLWS